jgi:hypothetical protein
MPPSGTSYNISGFECSAEKLKYQWFAVTKNGEHLKIRHSPYTEKGYTRANSDLHLVELETGDVVVVSTMRKRYLAPPGYRFLMDHGEWDKYCYEHPRDGSHVDLNAEVWEAWIASREE